MNANLLTDPIIPVRLSDGSERNVSLPDAFHLFASGESSGYARLRAHQSAAIHMWGVQVAVVGVHRISVALPNDADGWRKAVESVAPAEAWELIGKDSESPAFMQPPMERSYFEKLLGDESSSFVAPDGDTKLTTLAVSKNHAVKSGRLAQPDAWDWACALIELQTMSAFGGRDNYGAARMNGGRGSRPLVSVYPNMKPAARWLRDVQALLERRGEIVEEIEAYDTPGEKIAAVWCASWKGEEQLTLNDLDPLFIEVCRRVRLVERSGTIEAVVGNSKKERIAAKHLSGLVGDPWTPVNVKEGKTLTVIDSGWTSSNLRKLILRPVGSDLRPSLLQTPRPSETGDMIFHASVMSRGDKGVSGLHEVSIPIPGHVMQDLLNPQKRESVGVLSEEMVAEREKASKCLYSALMSYLQGGPDEIDWNHRESKSRASAARDDFNNSVEAKFFQALWRRCDGASLRDAWSIPLADACRQFFDAEIERMPARTQIRPRAEARARRTLEGAIRNQLQISEEQKS